MSVSVDDMMVDTWVSREVVKLKLPIAIANIRSKLAAGISLVTRERTTYSKYVVPPPSSYVHHRESLPMLPDPAFAGLSEGRPDLLGEQGTCQGIATVFAPEAFHESRTR